MSITACGNPNQTDFDFNLYDTPNDQRSHRCSFHAHAGGSDAQSQRRGRLRALAAQQRRGRRVHLRHHRRGDVADAGRAEATRRTLGGRRARRAARDRSRRPQRAGGLPRAGGARAVHRRGQHRLPVALLLQAGRRGGPGGLVRAGRRRRAPAAVLLLPHALDDRRVASR